MRHLLIATKNAHKTAEIRAILGAGWEVSDLTTHPEVPSPEETGATFEENAVIKALAASRLFDGLVLADDSGLEVDALGGEPGVRSARYAGEKASDANNRAKLLNALAEVPRENRHARFRCVMALAQKNELIKSFEGTIEGTILTAEHGTGGFGFDSLFVPTNHSETFAELTELAKNSISHRRRALNRIIRFLDSNIAS